MDGTEFVALVRAEHPDLVEEIELLDPEPNPTLAAGALARRARAAIDQEDRTTVERCFGTAMTAWDEGSDRVRNAVGLSFLAKLNFADGRHQRSWALALLHPRLREEAISAGNSSARP